MSTFFNPEGNNIYEQVQDNTNALEDMKKGPLELPQGAKVVIMAPNTCGEGTRFMNIDPDKIGGSCSECETAKKAESVIGFGQDITLINSGKTAVSVEPTDKVALIRPITPSDPTGPKYEILSIDPSKIGTDISALSKQVEQNTTSLEQMLVGPLDLPQGAKVLLYVPNTSGEGYRFMNIDPSKIGGGGGITISKKYIDIFSAQTNTTIKPGETKRIVVPFRDKLFDIFYNDSNPEKVLSATLSIGVSYNFSSNPPEKAIVNISPLSIQNNSFTLSGTASPDKHFDLSCTTTDYHLVVTNNTTEDFAINYVNFSGLVYRVS